MEVNIELIGILVANLVGLSTLGFAVAKLVSCIRANAAKKALESNKINSIDTKTDEIKTSVKELARNQIDHKVVIEGQQVLIERNQQLLEQHIQICENLPIKL